MNSRSDLPIGTVTFLLTDVEGSTKPLTTTNERCTTAAARPSRRLRHCPPGRVPSIPEIGIRSRFRTKARPEPGEAVDTRGGPTTHN